MRRVHSLLTLAAIGAVTFTGCSSVDEPGASAVAQRFLTLARTDATAACELLAPQTAQRLQDDGGSCPKGLQSAKPPAPGEATRVTVAMNSAQVRMGDQAVFLARFDSGWRVTAAGCTRESSDDAVPYRCAVEGS
ncbi:hypothetical protein [Terrabacter sp. NPDC080008]|uniref:hypothetical protein n=1 Tax=Terrabacter sp. NPDC080008 TaxID=3155176 RepID=UPI00344EF3A5